MGRSLRRLMIEGVVRSTSLRVDREKGIVYGVKIIGLQSPNRTDGSNGRRYLPEALQRAIPLYEGMKVRATAGA